MSVVNDMLKDLQERESIERHMPGSGKIIMSNENDVDAVNDNSEVEEYLQRRRVRPGMGTLWVVTAGVFFTTLAAGWWFFNADVDPAQANNTPSKELLAADVQGLDQVEANIAGPDQDVQRQKRNQVVELPSEEPEVIEAAPEPVSVEQLLADAEKALSVDRLTTPPGDNAYSRYQAVLAIEPDNQQALTGLKTIQQRYLGFVRSLIKRKEFYAIPTLVQKARDVGVEESTLQELLGQVKEAEEAEKLGKLMKAFEPVKREEKAVSKVVQPSLQERDRLVASKAGQLIDSQQLIAAERLLRDFVKENPKAVDSVSQLFGIYLQQNRLDEAENLINQAQHLPGHQFSYMVAQVLIKRQDLDGALRALESQQPVLANAPAYYALQAGLHHQRGENDKAVKIYQALIDLYPRQASYWLGLAVSLDSLGLKDATLNAFEKTLQLSDPQANYIPYVKQRLKQLSPAQ